MSKSKRILIADDDEALLFAFQRLFNDADIAIDAAESVDHARQLIDNHPYALVISDLRFGDDGDETGAEIIRHARKKSPQTKTILWTAYGNDTVEKSLKEVRPDQVLTKPVPSETIRDILKEMDLL
ncbi:MAG: response regulator [Chitinivibrionales bacterium]|nr:response regulator [Chitinivibrionales bacterium]